MRDVMGSWLLVCAVVVAQLATVNSQGTAVIRTRGKPGDPCEFADGVVGECTELRACRASGGVIRRLSTTTRGAAASVCSSSSTGVYICCRRPHIIAENMCSVWSRYWSAASRTFNNTCVTQRPLIYDGEEAILGEFPNMVSLGKWEDGQRKWQCGGTLITPFFVLTAAHCISSDHVVTLGEHDRSAPGTGVLPRLDLGFPPGLWGEERFRFNAVPHTSIEQMINVTEVFVYPEYQSRYHDIALLKLQYPATLTARVLPSCLPNSRVQHFDTSVSFIVAGWGAVTPHGDNSDKLRKAKINYIDPNECIDMWSSNPLVRPPWGITSDLICAGAEGKDSCRGDSGGPLMQESNLPEVLAGTCMPREVAGIVSFGPLCGRLGAYTKVASYLDWITAIVAPKASSSPIV
ncbi:chymotrypsin-like protease CTRL-1 [Hyalella azteca]|uniref:Chymotrypsin-like protease CTRL-1 n=1 Tax=Hyalella azteca TaxID=294128 RepID=A0A8B7N9X7_HYAAZ|nr:chymotrypsin-like protease CTRL-1 [Hyalella azteca]